MREMRRMRQSYLLEGPMYDRNDPEAGGQVPQKRSQLVRLMAVPLEYFLEYNKHN